MFIPFKVHNSNNNFGKIKEFILSELNFLIDITMVDTYVHYKGIALIILQSSVRKYFIFFIFSNIGS